MQVSIHRWEVKPIMALPCPETWVSSREDADSCNGPEGHRGIISSEKGALQEATDWFHPPGILKCKIVDIRGRGCGGGQLRDNGQLRAPVVAVPLVTGLWSHGHAHLAELHAYMHHVAVVVSRSRWGMTWVLLSWLWGCFIVRCLPEQSWGGPAALSRLYYSSQRLMNL